MKELIRVLEDFYSLPWEQKVKYVSDDVTSRPVRYGTSLYTTCATLAILWKVIYNTGQLILSVTDCVKGCSKAIFGRDAAASPKYSSGCFARPWA
ncbi:Oxoglutarate/iron-dependent dioxygenase [Cinnamomum micranthum f. kanehirae]|uniref:Oxoglutarate/iron-dependent dioxygenase n=1 Tax=Cinnamomum micranthum f. kanehirae TaxID=337451 RepID=A0A443Q486_9MAGN|nr:Oxoglutarate/iron-dependent dioxygenase [Cinnamomum micranthum f. kanehirae]